MEQKELICEKIISIIEQDCDVEYYCTEWSKLESKKNLYMVKLYLRFCIVYKNKEFETYWEQFINDICSSNRFKKYVFKTIQMHIIENIMSGYFNELNPSTLNINPELIDGVLNIYVDIETFPSVSKSIN